MENGKLQTAESLRSEHGRFEVELADVTRLTHAAGPQHLRNATLERAVVIFC